ncbi:MAG: hypothetical protein NTY12_02090 [Candidatus Falkowbacteria bacterium]|nr:hypothetical protein [Candidatus Falkowbacteria bacterium]
MTEQKYKFIDDKLVKFALNYDQFIKDNFKEIFERLDKIEKELKLKDK